MKKIVALGAIAALAGGMIFAEPVFEPSVTLSGEAKVEWGMDLDAGKTGFKNSTGGDFKVKLWGDGSRELEKGDGIWAELKSTGKAATIDKGTLKDGGFELNEAKLHINDFYIGIIQLYYYLHHLLHYTYHQITTLITLFQIVLLSHNYQD